MSSPLRNKVSVYPETAYGTAVTSGATGRAYQVTSDGGPTPISSPVSSDGMYSGREGLVDETIEQIIKGYDLSFTKALRTHGDELWFLDSVGEHGTAVVANPATTPATYTKPFNTTPDGPSGSFTIVLDRFTLNTGGNDLTQSVFAGCMVKSWGVSVAADGNVELTQDYVARAKADTSGATVNAAAYPAATVGNPQAFTWQNCTLRVADAGTTKANLLAASAVNYLRSFSYTQDNALEVDRYYLGGDSLMDQPYTMGPTTGSVELEFDYSTALDPLVFDKFEEGEQVSVLFQAARAITAGNYFWRLYLPSVFLSTATRAAGLEGATTLSGSGEARWIPGSHLAEVDYGSEGNSNP